MDRSDAGTRLVLLGTAGGSATYMVDEDGRKDARHGISSALVVDGHVYLVDVGQGAARQLTFADIGGRGPTQALSNLQAVFLTHLHSDHTMDLANLLHCSYNQGWRSDGPVDVFGPGPRGRLPAATSAPASLAVCSSDPTPGTRTFVSRLIEAFSTDLNDRVFAGGKRHPVSLVRAHDVIPPGIEVDPNYCTHPPVQPWVVATDDRVTVSATLVAHGAMYPCLAYRFDTADGSVVFSGDTSPSHNLVRLSQGADVLVHEAIHPQYGEWQFGPGPHSIAEQASIEATMSKHTSTDQVGGVAQAAGVSALVLSHLVPASIPGQRWASAIHGFDGKVIVGEDLLEIEVRCGALPADVVLPVNRVT